MTESSAFKDLNEEILLKMNDLKLFNEKLLKKISQQEATIKNQREYTIRYSYEKDMEIAFIQKKHEKELQEKDEKYRQLMNDFYEYKKENSEKIEKILIEEEKRKELEKRNEELINMKMKDLNEKIKFKNSQMKYLEEQYQQTLLYCTSLSSELRLKFFVSEMYKLLNLLQKKNFIPDIRSIVSKMGNILNFKGLKIPLQVQRTIRFIELFGKIQDQVKLEVIDHQIINIQFPVVINNISLAELNIEEFRSNILKQLKLI